MEGGPDTRMWRRQAEGGATREGGVLPLPLIMLPPRPSLSIQVPYLGVRKKDDNGKLGPYTWMTYAQVIQ